METLFDNEGVYTYNGEEKSFNFRTSLRAADKVGLVNEVVKLLVNENDNRYHYIVKDIVFNFTVIRYFTDIDILKDFEDVIEDKVDTPVMETVVEYTDIIDVIMEHIDDELIDELKKAVDYNVEYITGIRINSVSNAFVKLLNAFEKKIEELDVDSAVEMLKMVTDYGGELTPENIWNAYAQSDARVWKDDE